MTTMTALNGHPKRVTSPRRRGAAAVGTLAAAVALLAGCSSGNGDHHDGAAAPVTASSPAGSAPGSAAPVSAAPSTTASSIFPTTAAGPGAAVPQVRDSFAVLQATYNDNCGTPGNCEYFLNRLLTNLDDLDNSMAASPKGSGHFAQPLAWIKQLQHALGSDVSFTNLKRHKTLLLHTRDEINTWMQAHPSDYR